MSTWSITDSKFKYLCSSRSHGNRKTSKSGLNLADVSAFPWLSGEAVTISLLFLCNLPWLWDSLSCSQAWRHTARTGLGKPEEGRPGEKLKKMILAISAEAFRSGFPQFVDTSKPDCGSGLISRIVKSSSVSRRGGGGGWQMSWLRPGTGQGPFWSPGW